MSSALFPSYPRIHRSLYLVGIIALISTSSCHVSKSITSVENHSQKIVNSKTPSNAFMDSLIAPYRVVLNKKMSDTLAWNPSEMVKEKGESELGNWVADGMKWYIDSVAHIEGDIAFCNYGGLRVKALPKGFIQLKHIFELMPFENTLIIVELDSNEFKTFLKMIIEKDGWPVSHGFQMNVSSENHLVSWSLNNERKNTYHIILSDYIANGGDNMDMLIDNKRISTTITIRDALIEYCKHQKNLLAQREQRWIKEKK